MKTAFFIMLLLSRHITAVDEAGNRQVTMGNIILTFNEVVQMAIDVNVEQQQPPPQPPQPQQENTMENDVSMADAEGEDIGEENEEAVGGNEGAEQENHPYGNQSSVEWWRRHYTREGWSNSDYAASNSNYGGWSQEAWLQWYQRHEELHGPSCWAQEAYNWEQGMPEYALAAHPEDANAENVVIEEIDSTEDAEQNSPDNTGNAEPNSDNQEAAA